MDELHNCLEIEFNRKNQNTTVLTQTKYIGDILVRFRMENLKPVTTPMDPGVTLSRNMYPTSEEENEKMSKIPHQSLIGSLLYLPISTRPNISFGVGVLSQYNTNYGNQH